MAKIGDYIRMNRILEAIDVCFKNAYEAALIGIQPFVREHLSIAEKILKNSEVQRLAHELKLEYVIADRQKKLEQYRRDLNRLAEIQHKIIYEGKDEELFEQERYNILKRLVHV